MSATVNFMSTMSHGTPAGALWASSSAALCNEPAGEVKAGLHCNCSCQSKMAIMGRLVTASLLVACLLVSASAGSTDWSIEDATRRVT